jgi:2-iminobutanoate/2-iminopropanoate deaminase
VGVRRKVVATVGAPKAIGPYSQAIAAGGLLFLSGQVALVPETGEFLAGDAATQARQCLTNLSAVLSAAGRSFADVVRTTVFLVDMADFQAVNAVYAEFAGVEPPARSTVAVAALPRGARVEIDAIAVGAEP